MLLVSVVSALLIHLKSSEEWATSLGPCHPLDKLMWYIYSLTPGSLLLKGWQSLMCNIYVAISFLEHIVFIRKFKQIEFFDITSQKPGSNIITEWLNSQLKSSRISYRPWLMYQLLHFPYTSSVWPGKGLQDRPEPWETAPALETWKKLLGPGFVSAQLHPLWSLG